MDPISTDEIVEGYTTFILKVLGTNNPAEFGPITVDLVFALLCLRNCLLYLSFAVNKYIVSCTQIGHFGMFMILVSHGPPKFY